MAHEQHALVIRNLSSLLLPDTVRQPVKAPFATASIFQPNYSGQGSSFGIIIDRPIMDLLGIEPGAELELTPLDGGLLLRPVEVSKDHKARARAASLKVRKIHRAALKELAE